MDLRDLEKAAADLRKLVDEQSARRSKLQDSIDTFVPRYQEWCLQESAAQLARDFDLVRRINNDETAIFLEYIATLKSKHAKAALVTALSKRMNWEESLSIEERQLCQSYIDFHRVLVAHHDGQVISAARVSANKTGRAIPSRAETQTATRMFRTHAENRLRRDLGKVIEDRDSMLEFECRVGNWYIVSAFDTGARAALRYNQTIHAAPSARRGTNLSKGISILRWMGISNATFWSRLVPDEMPQLVDNLYRICAHFLEVAPKLLEGLEPPANLLD